MGNIYRITNTMNNKVYVGQTIFSLQHRFRQHKWQANNGGDTYLYRAMRKYGVSNFKIALLEEVKDESLNEREIHYIAEYDSIANGYNMESGGNSFSGFKLSKEAVEKRQATREDLGIRTKNPKDWMSEKAWEAHQKTLDQFRGSPKVIAKAVATKRANNNGEYLSDEAKKRIADSQKGVNNSSWKGYLVTPHGVFSTLKSARTLLGTSGDALLKRIKLLPELFYYTKESFDEVDVITKGWFKFPPKKMTVDQMRACYKDNNVDGSEGSDSSEIS